MFHHFLPQNLLPHRLLQAKRHKRLADALLKLTEQRRNVLFLYFFFGYTDAQIGKEYGRNRSTANYWKLAALKQLRKEMERLEHEEQEADTL